MTLAATHLVHLKPLEADDPAWYCDIRSDHVSYTAGCLTSAVDHCNLHFLKVRVEAQLAQVIDTASVKLILRSQKHGEGSAADDLGNSDFRRHVLCDLRGHNHFTLRHAFTWLEAVSRESETELSVHGHAPPPDLILAREHDSMGLAAGDLLDLEIALSEVLNARRALDTRLLHLRILVAELSSL